MTPRQAPPMNRFGWAPLVTVGLTIFLQLLTLAFTWGVQTTKLQMIDLRVQRVEQLLMERGNRADNK